MKAKIGVGSVIKTTVPVIAHNFRLDRGVFGEVVNGPDEYNDCYAKVIGFQNYIPLRERDFVVVSDGVIYD
ncbi:hypothetical protein A2Z53_00535 [Candidatus Giovannonibacteria bacterium RIFCSPHIGHO2_02_42_15]|uniref:Uncharacterized protein n=2 Tax=Candidatus Giovannoniibacteriota TaxID=1752738 RepID=A0A1F5VLT7_9BACT|nr:MAG: hypothetical protein UV11_C0006G0047 [Candidatus Giovannonibacteria bacterium GW2011_GWF2_42_19]OGF64360.1 MAG: hypothetical protein A2Z53_00535 [Candidatus Giovannonibacteria bacterium RIFCSPHIGHO2_02_42_15]